MGYVSGAQTGCQAREMEKRVQGATLRIIQAAGGGGEECSKEEHPPWAVEAELRTGEGFTSAWDGGGDAQMGLEQWLGRVCQAEGSKPGKAHVEVGNLGAE